MKKIFLGAVLVSAAMSVACCGGGKSMVTMGSLDGEMDSLSYALGANIGYGMNIEMKDIPFDYERMTQGIEDAAFGKAAQNHEEVLTLLRGWFMGPRMQRAAAIARNRAQADSVRLAAGDTTRAEYPAADPAMFVSEGERDSISYAFGEDIGYNVRSSRMPVQIAWLAQGLREELDGAPRIDDQGVHEYLQYYFMVKRPAENAAASAAWLAEVEKKSGVKKTESGLLYKVVKAGDKELKATDDRDVVSVHYKGTTRDGNVFDASRYADLPADKQEMRKRFNPEGYDKDEPVQFPLNRVIPGWTEGMKLVGKGGKITLWIPAELAYGARPQSREIGANEALRFDVELVDVEPYVAPEPAEVEEDAEPEIEIVEME